MKEGFTTGSCAAAAALASCLWRADGFCPEHVEIHLPTGRRFLAEILPHENYCCGVVKFSGDDPDITNGCEVRAQVSLLNHDGEITFRAGAGVGTVTQPGLKLPPGEAAINPVPRKMIAESVRSVFASRAAVVTLSIPGGEALANKTFNPRLGITGGLSVLGTSGIVRPMSEDALKETIALEMSMHRAKGAKTLGLAFGNQGEMMLKAVFPAIACVQMSNFVGFSLDEAAKIGFSNLVIAGHPGKLVKVAGGVMQTHSGFADARRETLIAHLAMNGADSAFLKRIYSLATTDAAIAQIHAAGYDGVWASLAGAVCEYCRLRVRAACEIDAIFFDGAGKILGANRPITSA